MASSVFCTRLHKYGNVALCSYAILSHDFEVWIDAVWCALLCCNMIWCDYHVHDWITIVLIEEFFNCQKILYNQQDCHDWPPDLKRFYGIAKLSPGWATRFPLWHD